MSSTISRVQLSFIEKALDKLFAKLGIDVEFSGHFLDRLNDPRNIEQITVAELSNVYHSLYDKFGITISKTPEEIEEVIKSLSTDINIPVNIHFDRKTNKIDLVAKTIMRKKNFKTTNPVLHVESFRSFISK
jgi:phosphoribosylanthranilate isomerase